MPKLTTDIKNRIKDLPRTDLEKIVIRFAGRDKYMFGYLLVNYLDKEFGESDLFEAAREDLELLLEKDYKGRTVAIRQARALNAGLKRIAEFTKIVKQPHLEAELLVMLLDAQFALNPLQLGTFYASYDNRIARLVKKLTDLVLHKVHEDYRLEFTGKINGYLLTLHRMIPYNTLARELPARL